MNEALDQDVCPKDYLEPDWSNPGKVHDWKNYVTGRIRGMWLTFSPAQRAAIAEGAQSHAVAEEWE